ncbi:hypothetical protein H6G20_00150 [Desertifilum sp. FACHB-1129]|uniref:Uncharacterized protein n=2 Tax=Desertifilum tharense IPPAS B-1220 TaxID=1781255 RepID=A0A1E5QJN1_9CYAN|nr:MULTISPECIES: hypothetical protein [Desertifilum]MDA0211568.1 hypothetical protein [Cyanobacteria bacterium FC1]MBD2310092.1 hypothetical protein [Desertifilum sp. FACHB-1129]MBD2322104.1 hypothetical protein [Desertifilum sp. FACHB-866]MBD2333817.1 hypothetical protein [Desertifilum sp. FACHB-868]OEJ74777.1 hypothetical protein BH720_12935 [Desertifilum tharense IPPAS B-1220]
MNAAIYLASIPYVAQVAEQVFKSRQLTRQHQYLLTLLLQDFALSSQELDLIEQISQAVNCGKVRLVD